MWPHIYLYIYFYIWAKRVGQKAKRKKNNLFYALLLVSLFGQGEVCCKTIKTLESTCMSCLYECMFV